MKERKNFIPAFRFKWLTPWFDPFLRLIMRELTFKHRLVEEVRFGIHKRDRVLDLAMGMIV